MFEVSSMDQMEKAFTDDYYMAKIKPDVNNFVDREGEAGGIYATISGKMVTMTDHRKSVVGEKDAESRKAWNEFFKNQEKEKSEPQH